MSLSISFCLGERRTIVLIKGKNALQSGLFYIPQISYELSFLLRIKTVFEEFIFFGNFSELSFLLRVKTSFLAFRLDHVGIRELSFLLRKNILGLYGYCEWSLKQTVVRKKNLIDYRECSRFCFLYWF